jgi:hypothetical protein
MLSVSKTLLLAVVVWFSLGILFRRGGERENLLTAGRIDKKNVSIV